LFISIATDGDSKMAALTSVQVRLDDAERDALDFYRRQQLNPPSRSAAARKLLHEKLRLVASNLSDSEARA
jgi:hypothetical protein